MRGVEKPFFAVLVLSLFSSFWFRDRFEAVVDFLRDLSPGIGICSFCQRLGTDYFVLLNILQRGSQCAMSLPTVRKSQESPVLVQLASVETRNDFVEFTHRHTQTKPSRVSR